MAVEKENVVICAGDCVVTVMPALGGKLASIAIGGRELLQTPLNPYAPRTQTQSFADGDASGWDECLPSVAECFVSTEASPTHGPAHIPDHGDLWRIPWQVLAETEDSVTLRANCFSLPLQITRTLLLSQTATGWQLQLLYSLTNMGGYRVPWSWAAHPLFTAEPGDRILLPRTVETLRLEGSGGNRLGRNGDTVLWPFAELANPVADTTHTDLGLAYPADSGYGDKLFAGPLNESVQEGWCALERPTAGLRLTVRFDPAKTPYLGLWLCYGGWPEAPGLKQVCVALEPATAPVDSLAEVGSWSRLLDPGETVNWPMELQIDRLAAQ